MDVIATKVKPDDEKSAKGIRCQLYEAHKIPQHSIEEEEKFKTAIASINPKMGIATLLSNPVSEMVQTKFGSSPVDSTNSYQLLYTEANFWVNININSVLLFSSQCSGPPWPNNKFGFPFMILRINVLGN